MKGLILAGGTGTRLRPITHTRAKQLVPVANKPIMFYGLEAMAGAGVKQVGVIVGETAEEIRAAVGDGSRWGLEVTYLPQEKPLGLAHCVLIAQEFLGAEDFVMYLGDNLMQSDLCQLAERWEDSRREALVPTLTDGSTPAPAAMILLSPVDDPHRFGVAELDGDGRVVRLVEKPTEPPSNLALVGVYLFDRRIHDAVAAISPSARGELEITDAVQWLIDRGDPVISETLAGWWIDTGKLTPLLEANRLLMETLDRRIDGEVDAASQVDGRVVVEAGARLERCYVRGPVVIGADTTVVDAYLGPFTAVGARCHIERSEIEHSVIMDDSTVVNAGRLEDSLLGHHVEVIHSDRRPKATRLMVGDHSQVDLG